MGENQKKLIEFILSLNEKQVDKIIAELPRLKKLIEAESNTDKKGWIV